MGQLPPRSAAEWRSSAPACSSKPLRGREAASRCLRKTSNYQVMPKRSIESYASSVLWLQSFYYQPLENITEEQPRQYRLCTQNPLCPPSHIASSATSASFGFVAKSQEQTRPHYAAFEPWINPEHSFHSTRD